LLSVQAGCPAWGARFAPEVGLRASVKGELSSESETVFHRNHTGHKI
jgi:hypothetical protein